MRGWYIKREGALHPYYPSDRERFNKIENNRIIEVEMKQPRNKKHHDKFRALLRFAFHHWTEGEYGSPDELAEALKYEVGHTRTVRLLDGTPVREARSLSFSECDQLEFNEVYERIVDVIARKLDTTSDEVKLGLQDFL
jgi:hypothetical protein